MFLALTGVGLTIVSIIAFIIIIGVIITVHELGHLYFAKKAGILCHEFSIGMGPIIYKKQFGETRFCIRAIPIGGFVSMAGEETATSLIKAGDKIGLNLDGDNEAIEIILDENRDAQVRGEITDIDLYCENGEELHITLKNENEEETYYKVKKDAIYIFEKDERLQITPYDRCFESKTKWQRFITLFAGPLMNFILAIIVSLIVAIGTGVPNENSTKVGEVSSVYPAASFLEKNDEIVSVNGNTVYTWNDFSTSLKSIYNDYGTTVKLTIKRNVNGEEKQLEYEMETVTVYNYIGISNVNSENMKLSFVPNTDILGLEIGNTSKSFKYVTKSDDTYEYNLKKGDYLTGISIKGNEYDLTKEFDYNGKSISGWGYLSYIFNKEKIGEGAPEVKFRYYHKLADGTYKLIDYTDSKAISPYTDEVLKSQNVDAIIHGIGVSPVYKFDFFKSIPNAFKQFGSDCSMIFNTLRILIWPSDVRQVGVSDLSSFVGIFSLVETYVGAGILSLLAFVAMLSVNIGIVNLLPIPALDGGRILFLGIEAVSRKRIPRKVENIVNNVAFILLMILFIFVTYNDIVRLIAR